MSRKASPHYVCPVCESVVLTEPARSPKTGGGSFEICPACGFQHGVDDDDRGITYPQARAAWRKAGATWTSKTQSPPKGWSSGRQ